MRSPPPNCYIIAGPNGAGKTTFATEFLPQYAHCLEFVNPDMIAKGLSPFAPELAAARAGRLVLSRIEELAKARANFAMETTLSGRTYLSLFRRLKAAVVSRGRPGICSPPIFRCWTRYISLIIRAANRRSFSRSGTVAEPFISILSSCKSFRSTKHDQARFY